MSIYFVPNTSEEQYQLILDLLESVFTSEHEKTLLGQAEFNMRNDGFLSDHDRGFLEYMVNKYGHLI